MATYWENSCSFGLRYVSWYKYLIVNLVFSPHLGFWSGNLFLIAPFPDLCLLVPFYHDKLTVLWLYCLSTYSFLAHLSQRLIGELIVYPCSGVRPSSVRRPQFQRSSSLKLLGRLFSYYTYTIYRKGERIIVFFVLIG